MILGNLRSQLKDRENPCLLQLALLTGNGADDSVAALGHRVIIVLRVLLFYREIVVDNGAVHRLIVILDVDSCHV